MTDDLQKGSSLGDVLEESKTNLVLGAYNYNPRCLQEVAHKYKLFDKFPPYRRKQDKRNEIVNFSIVQLRIGY
jgi:hypothetical protein